ncbi:MAG: aminoacyltransferase [Chloroflexi bacterium]|nr:aminoacyltransferase [Chloroflexota bacterium]
MPALRRALSGERCASLLVDPEVAEDPLVLERLAGEGVHRTPVYVQPRRTLIMDLSADPEDLLTAMRKKTRQYVHKAERDGVLTEETEDLDRFLAVMTAVGERGRFGVHDRAYFEALVRSFGPAATVMMARMGSVDAGALLLLRMGDRAWELFGGWNGKLDEHRPFYLLKWRAMQRMRAAGVRRYDMWGLDEDGALAGVSNFKRGFGGEELTWIGALETPVTRWLYPLWKVAGRARLARGAA